MKTIKVLLASMLVLSTFSLYAQKGTGQKSGVAQSNNSYELVTLQGSIETIKKGPCHNTTGRYDTGSHLIIKVNNGNTLNIHLGPAVKVSNLTNKLSKDSQVEVTGFQTSNVPENQYIAKIVSFDGTDHELRDDNLKPFWSGKGKKRGRGKNKKW